ncbi:cytochrome P450 [Streptomyces sp. E5N91]|uniref:cytochrome P450 n=1 Tax=Streptomyces sp. E5N91 TaxID=1851996 RepID=UPI000EF59FF7|nr:cytochrome P450 [Streptomyces sp. E5N91]
MVLADARDDLAVPAPRGACPFAPPPAYEQARTEAPVKQVRLWDGSPCWLVTRHEDIRTVLSDPRFSADDSRPGYPFHSASRKAASDNTPQTFLRMDDPEHARLRRMLTADFMVRKVETLRPAVQRIADGLLDTMTTGSAPADLVAQYCLPLPSLAICRILGVPYEKHDFFQERSNALVSSTSAPQDVRTANQELADFLTQLADEKRQQPDDGIISTLAGRGELSPEEVSVMGRLLLVAGHETTANMTALSVLALLRHPEQLTLLRGDPALIPQAVEELLRYVSIVQAGVSRVATQDVVVNGRLIEAGEGVVCMLNAANHDEDVFVRGGDLDVRRDARHHVAFGFGVHQCLGQPLARVELQVAVETLLRRLPGLRLTCSFDDIRFQHDRLVYGIDALPVAW